MTNRRTILLGAAATAAAGALSGCGLGGSRADSTGSDEAAPKPDVNCTVPTQNLDSSVIDTSKPTGTINFATQNLKTDFSDFFNSLIADFEKANPGTKIVWEDAPKATDFDARMVSDARTCVMADVINVPSSTIMALTKANLLLDLDIKAPESGKAFIPGVWKALGFGPNGGHTAYPWYWSPSVTTYNTKIFKAAGLDPQTPPATMQDLFDDARQIAQRTDDFALWGNPKWPFLSEWYGMGVKIMNADHTEFTFAQDSKAQQWLSSMAALYKAGAIPPDSVTGEPDPSRSYNAGNLAFGTFNASFLRSVKKNAPSLYHDTAVGPSLRAKGQGVLFNGQFIAVSVTTKNAPLALKWAQHVTNAKSQLAWCKDPDVVIFPSTTASLKDPFFSQPASGDPLSQARAVAAKDAQDAQADLASFLVTGKIETTLMEQFQLAITGKKDAQAALTQAQETANPLLKSLQQ